MMFSNLLKKIKQKAYRMVRQSGVETEKVVPNRQTNPERRRNQTKTKQEKNPEHKDKKRTTNLT